MFSGRCVRNIIPFNTQSFRRFGKHRQVVLFPSYNFLITGVLPAGFGKGRDLGCDLSLFVYLGKIRTMAFWKNNTIPGAPYYANIFILTRSEEQDGYRQMDEETLRLVKEMPGFLGYENVNNGRDGIFISYWESMDAINEWRENSIHKEAKQKGKELWYDRYLSQVCKIESSHEMIRKK